MAFSWNPFSQFEFDDKNVVIRHPNSGYFARITGPIVELLSQLPFSDVDVAVRVWQDRTGAREETLRMAGDVWQKLCDWDIVLSSPKEATKESNPSQWITLMPQESHSHVMRFMDFQDFQFDEDKRFGGNEDVYDDDIWSLGA
ncbi:MAG: hypothetical protein OSA78_07860 [Flavobacteriales bacterium]|nr:hypothetical protein [Flavobacteriales bacterium]